MNVTDPAGLNTRLANFLDTEDDVRVVDAEVRIAIPGAQEAVLRIGHDDVWRLVFWITYGNTEFVNGRNCDASGFVVSAEVAHRLEVLVCPST